jgi:hypothetical protein
MTSIERAWDLSLELSVRDHCRLYERIGGHLVNSTRDAAMGNGVPDVPWAIYLADGTSYHLVCFDLDCHDGDRSETARQAGSIRTLLEERGIRAVECVSGPAGGRHVWAASLEGLPADLVATLARGLKITHPRLDIACLTNPVTGCARPPYSPHRDGGASRVMAGDTDCLEMPTTRLDDWERLTEAVGRKALLKTREAGRTAEGDGRGHPWIPGIRKPLSEKTRAMLNEPLRAGEDASVRQWRILLAMAAAHWTFDHALEQVNRPGLTHSASMKKNGRRIPRPSTGARSARAALAGEWRRAVEAARSNPQGNDPTFEPRCLSVARAVQSTLRLARSRPGRWRRSGGASEQRVLFALCRRMLHAVTTSIEASVRTLALDTGMGRETVRQALLRLSADHWIANSGTCSEEHANHWKITEKTSYPQSVSSARSQVNTPPTTMGQILRRHLLTKLTNWLTLASHDLHQQTDSALRAGNSFADTHSADQATLRLLDTTAYSEGKAGLSDKRRQRYAAERLEWEWWRCEKTWMSAPAASSVKRRTLSLPSILRGAFPPMPRLGRRIDWRKALETTRSLTTQISSPNAGNA